MTTPYNHHEDAIAMVKAIGNLPFELRNSSGSPQYIVRISSSVFMSIIRFPSHIDQGEIDYSYKGNYEIALFVDNELQHQTVEGHLTTDDIERLITEYRYGPLPIPEEMSK